MDIYDPIAKALGLSPIQYNSPSAEIVPISEGMSGFIGKTHSNEWKLEASKRGKNRVWSDETKKKISEKKKGCVFTEEHRAKLAAAKRGRKHSEKTKQKISLNNRWNKKGEL